MSSTSLKVYINDCFRVVIDETEGFKENVYSLTEDSIGLKFMEWLVKHPEVRTFRGGSSGRGSYVGWFYPEGREAVEAFFAENGVTDE